MPSAGIDFPAPVGSTRNGCCPFLVVPSLRDSIHHRQLIQKAKLELLQELKAERSK